MRCLIATLGGDAPGVNAAVRAVTRIALKRGADVFGARLGWLGLLRDEFWQLKDSDVASVLSRGGSVLGSTDAKINKDDTESHRKIAMALRKYDVVVATGGLGSFAVLNRLYESGLMARTTTMFVPASVEGEFLDPNVDDASDDVHAESIGFDTAANRAVDVVDCLRDQAFHSRTVFLVECVGSKSNCMPIQVGLACGAHRIYLPLRPRLTDEHRAEIQQLYGREFDPNYVSIPELVRWIEAMFERGNRKYLLVILPSGVPVVNVRGGEAPRIDYEDMMTSIKPLELTVLRVAEALDVHFSDRSAAQVRHVLLDDLQRGGAPTLKDRVLGSLYGEAALEEFLAISNGEDGYEAKQGNLNLLAIAGTDRVAWRCFPRQQVQHIFQGEEPRAGGLSPLPFLRQARGVIAGYKPLAAI